MNYAGRFTSIRRLSTATTTTPLKTDYKPPVINVDVPLCQVQQWHEIVDPQGWWITEKYDGVRAFWNGKGKFFNSHGDEIKAPGYYMRNFPKGVSLDGELWCGKGKYKETWDIVSGLSQGFDTWQKLTYQVFDAPTQNQFRYEERMDYVRDALNPLTIGSSNAVLVEARKCASKDDLLAALAEMDKQGGEGLVLRRPKSFYHDKGSMLKVESNTDQNRCITSTHVGSQSQESDDAVVLRHQREAMLCKTVDGKEVVVSIDPKAVRILPEIGSVITFKHMGFDEGAFKSPKFYRSRLDVKWDDICNLKWLPYQVSYGKQLGGIPRCRGCKQQLRERGEPRLTVTAMFAPPNSGTYPGKCSFCMNVGCVQQAIKEDSKKSNLGVVYPPFEGVVGVPAEFADKFDRNIPALQGVTWVEI